MKCEERRTLNTRLLDVCVGMCVVYIVLRFFFLSFLVLFCRLCSRYISM